MKSKAYSKLFHSDRSDPTNVGNPNEFTILQLAEIVREEIGSDVKIATLPLPKDDPKVRRPDITVARSVLGWEPKIELREGLRRTIPYFRAELGQDGAHARTLG